MSGEIVHYGVTGMKWGVRKKEELSAGELETRLIRRKKVKRALIIGASAVAVAGAAYASYKVGGDYLTAAKHYSQDLKLDSMTPMFDFRPSLRSLYESSKYDETVAKGHEFIRRSKVMETSINSRAYVSATEEWSKRYGAEEFGEHLLSIKPIKDIRTPSFKTQVDTVAETFTRKDLKKTLDRTTLGRRIYQNLNLSNTDLAMLKLENFASNWWTSSADPDIDTYFETMTKRGYSATRDFLDRGDAYVLWSPGDFKVKSYA